MTFTFYREGSALELPCTPLAAGRPGALPSLRVSNWKCTCGSAEVLGRGMRPDGPRSRTAEAVCRACGKAAGRILVDGLPAGSLPV